jgi:hypothetical protein
MQHQTANELASKLKMNQNNFKKKMTTKEKE